MLILIGEATVEAEVMYKTQYSLMRIQPPAAKP